MNLTPSQSELLRSIPQFNLLIPHAICRYIPNRLSGTGKLDARYPAYLDVQWDSDDLVSRVSIQVFTSDHKTIAKATLQLLTDDPIKYSLSLTWEPVSHHIGQPGCFSPGVQVLMSTMRDMLDYLEDGI